MYLRPVRKMQRIHRDTLEFASLTRQELAPTPSLGKASQRLSHHRHASSSLEPAIETRGHVHVSSGYSDQVVRTPKCTVRLVKTPFMVFVSHCEPNCVPGAIDIYKIVVHTSSPVTRWPRQDNGNLQAASATKQNKK